MWDARIGGLGPLLVRTGPLLLTGRYTAITVGIPLTGYSRVRNRVENPPCVAMLGDLDIGSEVICL